MGRLKNKKAFCADKKNKEVAEALPPEPFCFKLRSFCGKIAKIFGGKRHFFKKNGYIYYGG